MSNYRRIIWTEFFTSFGWSKLMFWKNKYFCKSNFPIYVVVNFNSTWVKRSFWCSTIADQNFLIVQNISKWGIIYPFFFRKAIYSYNFSCNSVWDERRRRNKLGQCPPFCPKAPAGGPNWCRQRVINISVIHANMKAMQIALTVRGLWALINILVSCWGVHWSPRLSAYSKERQGTDWIKEIRNDEWSNAGSDMNLLNSNKRKNLIGDKNNFLLRILNNWEISNIF